MSQIGAYSGYFPRGLFDPNKKKLRNPRIVKMYNVMSHLSGMNYIMK